MLASIQGGDGGRKAAVFKSIWLVDFEFRADPGERPWPVCMVANDLQGGRELRLWRDELLAQRRTPFDCGDDDLFVSFYAPAELGCMLELGWNLPTNILDLYVEHRVATNGRPAPFGNSLLGVLTAHCLGHIDPGEKQAMRYLVMNQTSWSAPERKSILNYCASDVAALAALFPAMLPHIALERALLRGRYMAAVARMERTGIPIDIDRFQQLAANWSGIKGHLIAEVDKDYGVYEGLTFKQKRFSDWLERRSIDWPKSPAGRPKLDDDTFKLQAKKWPAIEPLRFLRQSLSELRLNDLQVGHDGRSSTRRTLPLMYFGLRIRVSAWIALAQVEVVPVI